MTENRSTKERTLKPLAMVSFHLALLCVLFNLDSAEAQNGGERAIQPWLTGIIAVIVFLILVFIAFLINRMWCENKEETNELEVTGTYTTTEHVNTNNMQCNENEYANDKSMQHNENRYASINGVQSNEYYTLKETMRSTEHSNAYDNIMAEEEVGNVIVTAM
ncbi:PDZK1-interacting protein 1 [Protopterus annectens]|uniref:PDZK1-interacting protein 1 n=1 Tax=Protopterus annectens TaxID=7888 RepID=UPI001CFAB6A6|nr:PDZK1-interacting protein 1 [Protopterus annectens]